MFYSQKQTFISDVEIIVLAIKMVDKLAIVQCTDADDVVKYINTPQWNGFTPCVKYVDWTKNVVYILVADYWDVL